MIINIAPLISVYAFQKVKDEWKYYIEQPAISGQTSTIGEQHAYCLVELEKGVKKKEIKDAGLKVYRQIDRQHFIVKYSKPAVSVLSFGRVKGWYPVNNLWKLSPALFHDHTNGIEIAQNTFLLKVEDLTEFQNKISSFEGQVTIQHKYPNLNMLQLKCSFSLIYDRLLAMEEVVFVGNVSKPAIQESQLLDANLAVNAVNLVQHQFPELNGSSELISIKEQHYDSDDIDIRGRHLPTGSGSNNISRHTTDMATIIGGGANSSAKSKGVVPAVRFTSSDFAELMPDPDDYFSNNGIGVQNHSYGTEIENFYGAHAHAYDLHTQRNSTLLHIFSAGNIGNSASEDGPYAGLEGFANLSGNFKMAKNILTVGAIDTLKVVDPYVSKGPAYDGRVKPELVAYSSGGSSNSAAQLSGIATMLRQAYRQQYQQDPPAALLKAILLNSAEDVGPKGIDYYSGYGSANAHRALTTLQKAQFMSGELSHAETIRIPLQVPGNVQELKISLVWPDAAADPNAAYGLVNDLDLKVHHIESQQNWHPWVLNSYPHADSLKELPERKEDHLNTVEQVSIEKPAAGLYEIELSGYDIPHGPQAYYVVYEWKEQSAFSWTYPTGSDNMPHLGERSSIFRWENTFSEEKGLLEYSIDGGESWILIDDDVDLQKEYYQWQAPQLFATAIARMQVGELIFTTDTFTISRPVQTSVGFNCDDSVMLQWPSVENAERYVLYTMGDQYLQPAFSTTDTFMIVPKIVLTDQYFAMSPILTGGKRAVSNQTFDYGTQGVDCYIAYFTATAQAEEGIRLELSLGTTHQVRSIRFERKKGGGETFQEVKMIEFPPSTSIGFVDDRPGQGLNYYRALVEFENGEELYTGQDEVYFLTEMAFLVFPNPLQRNDELRIFSKRFEEKIRLRLINQLGQVVMEREVITDRERVSLNALAPGTYYYILEAENQQHKGKLFIQ